MKDTIVTDKVMRPAEEIVERLIALRDELFASKYDKDKEVFWKINSCLYEPKIKI